MLGTVSKRRKLGAAIAFLLCASPALAQSPSTPATAAPSAEKAAAWRQQLGQYAMASTWLRRCPTEGVFRQKAAETLEILLSEVFHGQGMTEPTHDAARQAGRQSALASCTDVKKAEVAAQLSAAAFIALTAEPEALPCGLARAASAIKWRLDPEIKRAHAQLGGRTEGPTAVGRRIVKALADPRFCDSKRSALQAARRGWLDVLRRVVDADAEVQMQDYGTPNSSIWRVEAQRGINILRAGGLYLPCRAHTPWLEPMAGHYECELKIDERPQLSGEIGVIDGCTQPKCYRQITAVELQLFPDSRAATPTARFAGTPAQNGRYSFPPAAMRALLDPALGAAWAFVRVSGVTQDGRAVTDGFPVAGSPPRLPLTDIQDGYSWAFAPASVINRQAADAPPNR